MAVPGRAARRTEELYLGAHPRAAPDRVAKALVPGAGSGEVTGRGAGSPDRLLRVART